jgi:glutamate-1-semialdehyde 2,1-aminomutase
VATAAGLAALAHLDDDAYAALEQTAVELEMGLREVFATNGVAAQVTRAHTLVGTFFAATPVRNYDDAKAADHARYAQWFHGLLDRGVYVAPSGYEVLFPSLAHTPGDIEKTVEAAAGTAASL